VKDRLFSGSDVEDALAAAVATLGLPRTDLRYVVLDEGSAGGRGLSPTPARIAVLLHDPTARAPRTEVEAGVGEAGPARAAVDVRAAVRSVVHALAEAARLSLECDTEDVESALQVYLHGSDSSFFHGEDGKGEPLRAFEHVLQRSFGEALRPRQLRLSCEGYRERRDCALGEEAREVAAAVRASGEARALEPMNSYERRIVHLALQDEPGIRTFSVGEGAGRRVTVAPAAEPGAAAAAQAAGDADGH
jgi:spoIIIJ-associated protein